jgi:aquaporin Z
MKKYVAELIGTMCLVLFGCGAAVISGGNVDGGPAGLGLLGISLAFGFAVVAMAYTIGGISGCHINPAITIAMLVAGKINSKDAIGYIVAQFAGATIGAAIVGLITTGHTNGYGANGWGDEYLGKYSMTAAFTIEAVMTFLFLYVIFNVTSKHGNSTMAGFAIGITLVLIHMVAIPVTGTSVNPARSFGPAVFAGGKSLEQLWLFIVAPIVGAVAAALFWKATGEDH